MKRVAALDVPLPMAPNLERSVLPSVDSIAAYVGACVGAGAVA